jgi:hypothetical protein
MHIINIENDDYSILVVINTNDTRICINILHTFTNVYRFESIVFRTNVKNKA